MLLPSWLAGYIGMCPLTSLVCFLSPYPTHASGSLLLLQQVSDRLAARHVVLVVPSLPSLCDDDAGWVCWHVPSDQPSLYCFALPHTRIWIPPFSAGGE